jgi:3-oxoacyl-[acyl-carrier-protein] synthase III
MTTKLRTVELIGVADGKVYAQTFQVFATSKAKAIEKATSEILPDSYVFHQSNKMILDSFERLLPDWAYMPRSIHKYGNTSGASIPLTLTLHEVKSLCLLCGYGSGLTWGTAIVDLTKCDYKGIYELD